jgi:hypothetical protein
MYGNPLLFIKFGVNIEECNKEYCMLDVLYNLSYIREYQLFEVASGKLALGQQCGQLLARG